MRNRSDSLHTLPASRCNGKNPSTHPVSVETAFDRALQSGGIRVTDGSLYEAEPAVAIELIEEVGPKVLRGFPVPDCAYHLRVVDSIGTEWFVSFNGRLKEDTDGERSFLEPQLWNFHIDGQAAMPDAVESLLAPEGIDVLEEWLLGDRGSK
jgi:hypothetical protein